MKVYGDNLNTPMNRSESENGLLNRYFSQLKPWFFTLFGNKATVTSSQLSILATHVYRRDEAFLKRFELEISPERLNPAKGMLWAFSLSVPAWGLICAGLFML